MRSETSWFKSASSCFRNKKYEARKTMARSRVNKAEYRSVNLDRRP